MKFVAVIHGPATATVLNDEAYTRRFEVANPNIEVWGQALSDNGYPDNAVNPDVTITLSALSALSALSDLAIYGNRGYAFERL